ncbi:MAG: hypothetical protein ACYCZB_15225 [Acidiphilium sp.]
MFIRVKKIGQYEYLYLVENVREGGRHVQRVIRALGRRDEVENSDLLDGLIASAARHSRHSIVLSRFYRGELAELRRRSIGPDLVFGRLWQETGCAEVLRQHCGHIFCTFLALILRHELLARLAKRKDPMPEWQQIIDDLADLSVVDVEQDGRRARLRTAPRANIDPVCRAVGLSLPPVFQEMPSSKAADPAN